jgi:hypothetical protein
MPVEMRGATGGVGRTPPREPLQQAMPTRATVPRHGRPVRPRAASKRQDTIMPMLVARILVTIAESYALAGVLFALAFLPRGIVRVDERLRASPWTVRVLLLPGIAALWPLFAWRWITGRAAPDERNPHRLAAAERRP